MLTPYNLLADFIIIDAPPSLQHDHKAPMNLYATCSSVHLPPSAEVPIIPRYEEN